MKLAKGSIGQKINQGIVLQEIGRISSSNYDEVIQVAIPERAQGRTIFARHLSKAVFSPEGMYVQITFWHNSEDANWDLFYGYCNGKGVLAEFEPNSAYYFVEGEESEFISIISLILYFGWDAWLFTEDLTWLVQLSNDGVVDILAPEPQRERVYLLAEAFSAH